MSLETVGPRVLDYDPCRYGESRIDFRGPKRQLSGDYIAFLGGSETYGRFIDKPFPALLEEALGKSCVNFGCVNASTDVFVNDATVLEAAGRAQFTVIQVMGAGNMSNRFYRVHPRRNDRFLDASLLMRSVFRDIDFTEFSFTRHLLSALETRAADRFGFVRDELKAAWVARMRQLINLIPGRKLLFWFADHLPPKPGSPLSLHAEPLFIDKMMIEALRPLVEEIVVARASPDALAQGTEEMIFAEGELQAAELALSPDAHKEAAAVLEATLLPLLRRG